MLVQSVTSVVSHNYPYSTITFPLCKYLLASTTTHRLCALPAACCGTVEQLHKSTKSGIYLLSASSPVLRRWKFSPDSFLLLFLLEHDPLEVGILFPRRDTNLQERTIVKKDYFLWLTFAVDQPYRNACFNSLPFIFNLIYFLWQTNLGLPINIVAKLSQDPAPVLTRLTWALYSRIRKYIKSLRQTGFHLSIENF